MIWRLIKAFIFRLLVLLIPRKKVKGQIEILQEKVDELTSQIVAEMAQPYGNGKRLDRLMYDKRMLNRKIKRLRDQLGEK